MRTAFSRAISLALILGACGDDTTGISEVSAGISGSSSVQTCTGVVAGGTYENVKVPAGSSCTLSDVTVNGNVIALQDARLTVEESDVAGNIQGENAAVVHVRDSRIGGNVQIHEGFSPGEVGASITGGTVLSQGSIQVTKMRTGSILIADVILEQGNLQVEENSVTGSLDVLRNWVAQNLEVRKHFTEAVKTVSANTVGQKLECKENEAPFIAASNTAGDNECF